MQKLNNRIGLKQVLIVILVLCVITAVSQSFIIRNDGSKPAKISGAVPTEINSTMTGTESGSDKKREEESAAAFNEAYRVFMHPRCMNCHPSGDAPLQGDDSHIHTQNVTRGIDGKGVYAMKCSNCHQNANTPGENMPPGNPNWHLPPANMKMVFQGKTPAQLAAQFKNPKLTGKTLKELLHHVEEDGLVVGCWNPGDGRTKPPLSHEEFAAKVKEWIEKGAAIPK